MRKMTKAQFGLHIWIGIFLCLFSVSCSDDDTDSIKGDDDDTDLSINHWIEKKLRNDYLWYNELPATNKIDYTADPETFFYSLLSLNDGKQGMENTSTTILTWRRIKIIKHVPVLMQTRPMEWNLHCLI